MAEKREKLHSSTALDAAEAAMERQEGTFDGTIARYVASDGVSITLAPEDVVRSFLASADEVSEREITKFIALCRARHLNPFAGDCYLTPRNGKAVVTVSKDYWLRQAVAQPSFDGLKAGVVVATKDGLIYREGALVGSTTEKLVGGWAEVYDKLRSVPMHIEVSLAEYQGMKGSLWDSKPATMIRKVALVQALRESYPSAFAGLYDTAEIEEEA